MKGNINIRRHGRHQDAILLMAVCEMMREYKKGKDVYKRQIIKLLQKVPRYHGKCEPQHGSRDGTCSQIPMHVSYLSLIHI